jgi:hypothetical protein
MTAPEQLPPLTFPPGTPFDVRQKGAAWMILDRVRRRFVRLTPEEWVRQHLLRTLVEHLGYPVGLIALEPVIQTAGGPRRPDVVAYDRVRRPTLIVECKAPSVALSQEVFDQVSRYNVVTVAPLLAVTNGSEHYCWRVDRQDRSYRFLPHIPPYPELA